MIIPVGVDYHTRRYPVVMFTIMGLCALLFLPAWFISVGSSSETSNQWYFNLMLTPAESGLLPWLTHMFVHAGWLHVLGNMAYLFLFASPVEDILGRVWFTAFYLGSGLVAALVHILFTTQGFKSEIPLCGASGAISACMGAFILLQPKSHVHFGYFFLFLFRYGRFSLPGWLVISFWFLLDLLGLFIDLKGGGGEVAFGAHVGGFLFGMAFIAVLRPLFKGRFPGEREDDDEVEPPKYAIARAGTSVAAATVGPANILLWENGQQLGPFTQEAVRGMATTGAINPETCLYWTDGMADWAPLKDWA